MLQKKRKKMEVYRDENMNVQFDKVYHENTHDFRIEINIDVNFLAPENKLTLFAYIKDFIDKIQMLQKI